MLAARARPRPSSRCDGDAARVVADAPRRRRRSRRRRSSTLLGVDVRPGRDARASTTSTPYLGEVGLGAGRSSSRTRSRRATSPARSRSCTGCSRSRAPRQPKPMHPLQVLGLAARRATASCCALDDPGDRARRPGRARRRSAGRAAPSRRRRRSRPAARARDRRAPPGVRLAAPGRPRPQGRERDARGRGARGARWRGSPRSHAPERGAGPIAARGRCARTRPRPDATESALSRCSRPSSGARCGGRPAFLWMTPLAPALPRRFCAHGPALGGVLGAGLGGRVGALDPRLQLGADGQVAHPALLVLDGSASSGS